MPNGIRPCQRLGADRFAKPRQQQTYYQGHARQSEKGSETHDELQKPHMEKEIRLVRLRPLGI
jgi:hypothetical protein